MTTAPVAQRIEHLASNQRAGSSSLSGRTTTFRQKSRPPFSIFHSSIFGSSVLFWGRKVEKMENG